MEFVKIASLKIVEKKNEMMTRKAEDKKSKKKMNT